MGDIEPSAIWSDPYWTKFRERVHILLLNGYGGAIQRIKAPGTRDEPAITGFITEAIEQWLLDGPEWCDEFEVKDDPPISGTKLDGTPRIGRGRKRPDIIIGSTKRPRPKYFFEAKRLREKGGSEEYMGSDGMGCFIDGIYAREYHEGAMIGYFEMETANYWQATLWSEIDSKIVELKLIPPQEVIQELGMFPLEWLSKHNRPSVGSPISIFHILLDCCQE